MFKANFRVVIFVFDFKQRLMVVCSYRLFFIPLTLNLFFVVPFKTDLPCPQIGVADPTITPDSSFTASSSFSSYYEPHFARLRGSKRGWSPTTSDRDSKNSFLQIDLGAVYSICAVATQGENGNHFNEWTKSYKLQFSLTGSTWAYYKENGTDKVRFVFFLHISCVPLLKGTNKN